MKTRTSILIGVALDWAVAKCEGVKYIPLLVCDALGHWHDPTCYSAFWAQGGPIIERGGIAVERKIIEGTTEHEWKAYVPYIHAYGPTPLIAAMRCYVASKLGDEVEVPDALLS